MVDPPRLPGRAHVVLFVVVLFVAVPKLLAGLSAMSRVELHVVGQDHEAPAR